MTKEISIEALDVYPVDCGCQIILRESGGKIEPCAFHGATMDLLATAYAVMHWAKAPSDHGGNPYCKRFVRLAEAAIVKATPEEREVE